MIKRVLNPRGHSNPGDPAIAINLQNMLAEAQEGLSAGRQEVDRTASKDVLSPRDGVFVGGK